MNPLLVLATAIGMACQCGTAFASCSNVPLAEIKPTIDSFMLRPAGLLERYPRGDVALSGTIQNMVAVDADTTLDPILDLLTQANRYQKEDLGKGLAGAARQCDHSSQPWRSRQILDALRVKQDRVVMTAFLIAYRDPVPLAPQATDADKITKPLGGGGFSSPEVNLYRKQKLPDPFAPIR